MRDTVSIEMGSVIHGTGSTILSLRASCFSEVRRNLLSIVVMSESLDA